MRWQNLPPGLFYPLFLPHITKLCFKYRTTLATITKVNPAIPYGGLPFTPKSAIFPLFKGILPYTIIKKDDAQKQTKATSFARKYSYPIICKPDTGHRGIDVTLIENETQLQTILQNQQWDYVLQEFCDQPLEFGVFYMRRPSEKKGTIISLTKKIIPILKGDGKKTVEQLIKEVDTDNEEVLLKKYKAQLNNILPKDTQLRTMVTAAHAQGAIFTDAHDLITVDLISATDKVCNVDGFHFGRLDVKAKSIEEFKKGAFEIIEINGVTSEMIHIWDKEKKLSEALKDLKVQWNYVFEIANQNKATKDVPLTTFVKKYLQFFKQTKQITGKPW